MAIYKNVAGQKIAVHAYDTTTAAGTNPSKTGDAANITAKISKDGGATASTNDTNPAELSSTDAPGVYIFDLTQAETDAEMIVIYPVSATANILLDPIAILTIPTTENNADALLDRAAGVETGLTPRQAMRLIAAASAGKLSGAATTTLVIRNIADDKDRITATVDADGNRTTIVTDLT
jgi:hypothetical protein